VFAVPYLAKEYSLDLLSEENVKKYVLPKYSLQQAQVTRVKFKNTAKQRAVYKIDYLGRSYCLKKVYFLREELLFVYSAVEWLYRYNINVPRILSTNDNGKFVEFDNMLFILTPWIEGTKCDYDVKEHILLSVRNLAYMHSIGKKFTPICGSTMRADFQNLSYSISKHFDHLLSCSNLAFKYGDKFSKTFLQQFENNLLLAQISMQVSLSVDYDNLSSTLCHLDYVNKNIIFTDDKKLWVIDFDKCCMDYTTHDISYFLRRLLRRDNTNWDLILTTECLELYEKIHPLNLDEYKYILSYLSFPQKFWKISRDYYNNIKKCNHNAFLLLLRKSTEKDLYHLNFIVQFGKYIEEKFNTKIT
jgi:CotS family spore coat protein